MSDAREVLRAAGVPLGAIRPAPQRLPDAATLLAALRQVADDAPEACPPEALLAWLRAFAHHWPSRYAATLGDAGAGLAQRIAATDIDRNKYLKLRRIAIENLSRCL